MFHGLDRWRWWNIFTGRRYAHVWMITSLSARSTLILDSGVGTVHIWKCNKGTDALIRAYGKKGFIIATYLVKEQPGSLQFFISCVGFCKYVLNIRKWWIMTPKQLYREAYNVYRQQDS